MWNLLDLYTTLYQKYTESTFLKFNIFESFTNFVTFLNSKIQLLIPEILITTNMLDATITALKFLMLISMLVFIRGGIPRYRYDFLTKIGWIKFLSLILAVFLSTLLFVYVM
mgnify:FL=1